jgi:hypothetical protein
MKRACVLIIGCSLILSLAVAGRSRAESSAGASNLPKAVDDVLWWLPEDTQTVIVSQGPFKVDLRDPHERADPVDDVRSLQLIICGIPALRLPPALTKRLSDRTITLAVEGSRHFRGPKGLGLMPFEGAQILVFQDDLGADGKPLMNSWLKGATKIETISGIPVLMGEEQWERDHWSLYLAQPKPNILIGATNRDYLQTVLDRMVKRAAVRALSPNLPEWRHLDPTAKVWAIRHYDRKDAEADPSSPFGGKKEANEPDDEAVGLVFWTDPHDGGSVKVNYLSNNRDAVRIARRLWLHVKDPTNQMARQAQPGVVAISIPLRTLNAAENQGYFLFHLLAVLGHAIYL